MDYQQDNPAVYGLKFEARCMAPRLGEKDSHNFIVGTHSLKEKNEIHVIDFKEETNEVECIGLYSHPGEIWQLQASSCDTDLFASVYTDSKGWHCSAWKLGDGKAGDKDGGEAEEDIQKLKHVGDFKGHEGAISTLKWSVVEEGDEGGEESVVTIDSKRVRWWKLAQGGSIDEGKCLTTPEIKGLTTGCFDPHHDLHFVTGDSRNISTWDFRSAKKPGLAIPRAHQGRILDIDYNPNRPYHLASAGEDMVARFWDLRNPSRPINQLGGHTHWIWQIRFNRYHDQLLLTAGTDSVVNLWSIVSASSAPVGELEGTGSTSEKEGDKRIKKYEDHRDSVYSVAWSSDAWVFASLSYDGTVVVNNVPQSEKYKILL